MHRFTVTTQATIASAVFSFGTEHALKGNGTLSNQTIRFFIPTAGEQIPPLTGLWQPWAKRYPAQHSFRVLDNTIRITYSIKKIVVSTFWRKTRLVSIKKQTNKQTKTKQKTKQNQKKNLIKQAPKYWIHTVYTGMLPHTHKNLLKTTVENYFP